EVPDRGCVGRSSLPLPLEDLLRAVEVVDDGDGRLGGRSKMTSRRRRRRTCSGQGAGGRRRARRRGGGRSRRGGGRSRRRGGRGRRAGRADRGGRAFAGAAGIEEAAISDALSAWSMISTSSMTPFQVRGKPTPRAGGLLAPMTHGMELL